MFRENKYFVPTIGIINLKTVPVTSDQDLNSPIKSVSVSSKGDGSFTGTVELASGSKVPFSVGKFIYDATSAIYAEFSDSSGHHYITCGLYALIMAHIHKLILDARIASSNANDKYALQLSRDRLSGPIEQLKGETLISLAVVSNAFGVDVDGKYSTSNGFIRELFNNVVYDRHVFAHRGHILSVSSNSEYAEAFNNAINSNAQINEIKASLSDMYVLPDNLSMNINHNLPGLCLSQRKALELAFSSMLVFDVWPSDMQLATFDSMPAYIKGRLYKLALDNRANVASVTTQGQHESMSAFLSNYPNLASFLSNAVYPLTNTPKVGNRMSYIENVLKATNKADIMNLFDNRLTIGSLDAIKSDIRALGCFIAVVLCDGGSVVINSNGTTAITIPVYESSFLTYFQNGLVKRSYRS